MGTTLALLCVAGDFAVAANVGDSRIYLAREGRLLRVSRDHTVLSSELPLPRERRWKRKYVTRALGTRPAVEPDVLAIEVRAGDRFLLCSDGLTDVVRDEEILAALESCADRLETVPRALVDLANERGGRDNVTVVVARIVADEEGATATGGEAARAGAGPHASAGGARNAARSSATSQEGAGPQSSPGGVRNAARPSATSQEGAGPRASAREETGAHEDPLPPPPPLEPPPLWDG